VIIAGFVFFQICQNYDFLQEYQNFRGLVKAKGVRGKRVRRTSPPAARKSPHKRQTSPCEIICAARKKSPLRGNMGCAVGIRILQSKSSDAQRIFLGMCQNMP